MTSPKLPPYPPKLPAAYGIGDRIARDAQLIAALRARLALTLKALELIDQTAVAKRKGAIIVAQGIARATIAACREGDGA